MASKKARLSRIKDHEKDGISFYVSHVVEIFRAPLMSESDTGDEIKSASDLFRSSPVDGFDQLYVPASDTVSGESKGAQYTFASTDFLRWQLERVNPLTILHLSAKTESRLTSLCNTDIDPEEKILNYDEEIEKDPDYSPDEWLNPYNQDEESVRRGLELIDRLRKENSNRFCEVLIKAITDEDTGVLAFLETEIGADLEEVRQAYAHWPVPLMVVSTGKFYPYIERDGGTHLMMDSWKLNQMHVRNYDEDEPALE